jgi:hypothetical protein
MSKNVQAIRLRSKGRQAGAKMLSRHVVELSPSGMKRFMIYQYTSAIVKDTSISISFDADQLPIGSAIYVFIPGGHNEMCVNNSINSNYAVDLQADAKKVLSMVL